MWNLNKAPSSVKEKLNLNLQAGNPPTLHPYKEFDLRSRCLFLALYEPLMRKESDGRLACAAAESVDVDPTQTHYVFHIRKHQFWSNGEPLTSHHFEQAWKYALSPKSICARADLLYLIKNGERVKHGEMPQSELKIFAPDDYTLIVELEHPTPYFLDLTATPFFAPLYDISDKEPTDFNGPFMIGTWIPEQKMVFVKNPHYWDRQAVGIEEVCFSMIKDPTTALLMYEQGDLDAVGDPFSTLPFDAIPHLTAADKIDRQLISRILYLMVNVEAYPLHNKTLRQALAMSMERQELADHIFIGHLPAFSPLPKTLTMNDSDRLKYGNTTSLALFEKALQELHLTRETFPEIVFSYQNLAGLKNLAQWVQGQWKKELGIDIKIECLDWNTHAANLRKKQYQLGTLYLTTLYPDPMFYFDTFRDKSSTSNYTGWEHPQFRAYLEKAETLVDKNDRYLVMQAAEQLLIDEMPAIPLVTPTMQYMVQDNVKLLVTELGVYDLKGARKGTAVKEKFAQTYAP